MERFERMNAEQWRALIGRAASLILEIGCHDGSDTAMLLEAFPNASIHCWEPDYRPLRRFRELLAGHPRVTLHCEAVSNRHGWTDAWYSSHGQIHVGNDQEAGALLRTMNNDWDASGSTHRPTGHTNVPKGHRFDEEPGVPAVTLSTWRRMYRPQCLVDLLWIDAQAAELDIIAGGWGILPITRYAYLECYDLSLTPDHNGPPELYEGQPTFVQLCQALPGWTPLGLYNADSVLFRNDIIQ